MIKVSVTFDVLFDLPPERANEDAGTCTIYHAPKQLQQGGEMWRHELKHCAGFNHKEV